MKLQHVRSLLWCAVLSTGITISAGRTTTTTGRIQLEIDVPRPKSDDSFVFGGFDDGSDADDPEMHVKDYSEAEKACLSQKKFFVNDKCYSIANKGPCPKDEWLVLDKDVDYLLFNQPLRPVCKKKRCIELNDVWWPNSQSCIQKTKLKSEYCQGTGKSIIIDAFGDGMCSCSESYGALKNGNKCYEYYQQGPCRSNEVITYDITSGNAICSLDKCLAENRKGKQKRSITERDLHHISHYKDTNDVQNENVDENSNVDQENLNGKRLRRATVPKVKLYAPMEGDGKCYELGSAQVCAVLSDQSRFVVDQNVHVPRCSAANNQLNVINPGYLCNIDPSNKCRTSIEIKSKDTLTHVLGFKNQISG